MTAVATDERTGQKRTDGAIDVLRQSPVAVRYLLLGVLINQMGTFIQAFLVLFLLHQGFSAQRASLALSGNCVGAELAFAEAGGELQPPSRAAQHHRRVDVQLCRGTGRRGELGQRSG